MNMKATAEAHPNIAFIKYWGNRNQILRIPANGSLSMNLDSLFTRTTVTFDPNLTTDGLRLNHVPAGGSALSRVSDLLERVRRLANIDTRAEVISENNFPTGSGIASSASAFAALALAASAAAGLNLSEKQLSILARTGSGSAARSVPGGFVEWKPGNSHSSSYAYSIAPPEHWDLADLIAVVSTEHKVTGSTSGHAIADSSPLQAARVDDAPRRLAACRQALLDRDFEKFAEVVELDSNIMHAVMQTSTPPLIYWQPATIAVMHAVRAWRKAGLPVCYTIDAGPNVHILTLKPEHSKVKRLLQEIPGVQDILRAFPGGPAKLIYQEALNV
ncbi:MAG: diphosphomevalonate decarboxylase [Anaerolineales bacterium]|nr:diphosphomevalonate decarboxylase [Anaerolineales bacterium]